MKEEITCSVQGYKNQLIDSIFRLVRIKSTKGEAEEGMPFGPGPHAALTDALLLGKELGFETQNLQGYVGLVDINPTLDKGLDILAHLDVVPANPSEWTQCPPFQPVEKGGVLYGRGVSDDKGPALCALYAMKVVKDLNIPLRKNVRLILGTDEESGSNDIPHYYKDNPPAPATFSPDADFPLINVEKGRLHGELASTYPVPQGGHVLSAKAGTRPNVIPDTAEAIVTGLHPQELDKVLSFWSMDTKLTATLTPIPQGLKILVQGVGGHAAYPEKANNALTGLLQLLGSLPLAPSPQTESIKALSQLFPHGDWKGQGAGIAREDKESSYLTVSLNILTLSETELKSEFDSRTPLSSTKENTEDIVRTKGAQQGFTMKVLNTDVPHHVPVESPFIQTLLSVYEDYSGLKGYGGITGGGTYVHGLENAVAFGPTLPGTETNIHGADELAVVEELLLATQIFAQVIIDLCS